MSSGRSGGRFGPYHHRDGLPPQGHLYDEHGHRIHPEKAPPDPNDAGVDYGRVYEGPVKPKKPPKTDKQHRQGRRGGRGGRGGMARRNRKPKPVRIHPNNQTQTARAGVATQAYPAASQATGGAIPVLELDALSEVGLSVVLAELVNHGSGSRTGSRIARGVDRAGCRSPLDCRELRRLR
jgi:hypothetical protein